MVKENVSLGNSLKKYFLSGLVIFLPLALTINLFILTISVADGLLGKYIEPYFSREFGFYFRGLSILIAVLLIFIIGVLATNFLWRRIYPVFEGILLRLPFFKQVYPAIKEISVFLFSREKALSFQQVVLVQWPRSGVYSVGFLTNDSSPKLSAKTGQELGNVFIPHSPSPLTGFVVLVPKNEIIYPEMTVEEAIKFIVSGGVVV